jgi:hypothetical protein
MTARISICVTCATLAFVRIPLAPRLCTYVDTPLGNVLLLCCYCVASVLLMCCYCVANMLLMCCTVHIYVVILQPVSMTLRHV